MDWNSLIVVISVFGFATLEHRFPYVTYISSLYQRTHTNLLLGLVNISFNQVTIALWLNWILNQNYWRGFLHFIPSTSLQFIFVFLLLDAYLYGWHRLMHSHRWAWRFHYIHHTEHQINTSTAYRFHPLEAIGSNLPKLLMIWLFGMQINQILAYELVLAISLIFQHSNWSIPNQIEQLLGVIIITPQIHRTHHAKNIRLANSNFGSVLSVWDQIFNTLYYPSSSPKSETESPAYFRKLNILQLLILPFVIQSRKIIKKSHF